MRKVNLLKINEVFNHSNKFVCLIMIAFSPLFLMACHQGSGVEYDYEKQEAFRSLFAVGSSRQEVEEIIKDLEEITYDGEMQRLDSGISVFYRTSIELYGTFGYTFVYDDDMRLIYVIGQSTTD